MEINMNEIVGRMHILFLCLDALRYDVAVQEEEREGTPILNRYGRWRKCQAPGNFTYPSHQAMFAGFLPVDEAVTDMRRREKLFFSEDIGMGRKAPEGAYSFYGSNWIEGLQRDGYKTYCIGGVSFFDKRTAIGNVMPSFFMHSDWNPSFGCKIKESTEHQVDWAIKRIHQFLSVQTGEKKLMMYINVSAIHYPHYFYLPGAKRDSIESACAALRYVDECIGKLFEACKLLGDVFVICCSDHGSCYGENGIWYHGINHPFVLTVPYKHFFL